MLYTQTGCCFAAFLELALLAVKKHKQNSVFVTAQEVADLTF